MKRRIIAITLCLALTFGACGSNSKNDNSASESAAESMEESVPESKKGRPVKEKEIEEVNDYKCAQLANMSAEEIVAGMTLEQKAAQMVQPAVYEVTVQKMKENCYGSILSKTVSINYLQWQKLVDEFQVAALESESGIPYLYGQDDLHGVNYCSGAVIFPHNIGAGAANDPELMYKVGLATADEAKLCHMLWNFAPVLAQSEDPRWGRTYESYGSDLEIIKSLGSSYIKGLIDGDVVACAKHFFADGNVEYGTGEKSDSDRLIDRGDAILTDEEIAELLEVYQLMIDSGVQTIMISHSSVNGVKMHENGKYINMLKDEMGFEGFIVSDWDSVQNTSGKTYKEQIITGVNSGIDMFMEVSRYDEAMQIIINAVNNGEISEERINDAVTRIIRVKQNEGIFDDPLFENMETVQDATGSDEYRDLARQLVEESLVLVKNENETLPLKSGTKVYIMGPAADNSDAQCGGWTIDWNGPDGVDIPGFTTIKQGFIDVADEYNIEIVDNADDADVAILVVGEETYAEWYGDAKDLDLCGDFGLDGNKAAIDEAKSLGIPTVACIVAGRHVYIDKYVDNWDAIVMCYLPGSEGDGVANVLCGGSNFRGKLPSPWYSSDEQIGTDKCWLEKGYGLEY